MYYCNVNKKNTNMNTMEVSAEWIFRTELSHLGNEAKRRLIELLASSLSFPNVEVAMEKDDALTREMVNKHFGKWKDNRSAEEIIEEMHIGK